LLRTTLLRIMQMLGCPWISVLWGLLTTRKLQSQDLWDSVLPLGRRAGCDCSVGQFHLGLPLLLFVQVNKGSVRWCVLIKVFDLSLSSMTEVCSTAENV
jgi:hypothetical protein